MYFTFRKLLGRTITSLLFIFLSCAVIYMNKILLSILTDINNGVYRFGKKLKERDLFAGPVAKTPCSQCRGPGFDPWSEN